MVSVFDFCPWSYTVQQQQLPSLSPSNAINVLCNVLCSTTTKHVYPASWLKLTTDLKQGRSLWQRLLQRPVLSLLLEGLRCRGQGPLQTGGARFQPGVGGCRQSQQSLQHSRFAVQHNLTDPCHKCACLRAVKNGNENGTDIKMKSGV